MQATNVLGTNLSIVLTIAVSHTRIIYIVKLREGWHYTDISLRYVYVWALLVN